MGCIGVAQEYKGSAPDASSPARKSNTSGAEQTPIRGSRLMMTAGKNKGEPLLDGQAVAEGSACGVPSLAIDTGLEALIPPLSKEEYESLKKSLRGEGCREDIVVWKRGDKLVIVDGHHRYKLCRQYNIPFAILEKEFENADAAKAWMIRNQLARRNLTDYARCLLALELEPSLRREAKERQREGGRCKVRQNSYEPIDVKNQLAEYANVSHDTLNKVRVIRDKAIEQEKAQLSVPYSKLTIHGVYHGSDRTN